MAQISLHTYLQQIDTLLEENRLSEAIAHCRHILSKFPRYIDVYRLYGKALLEQQKFDDAVDIFQRVLSADPEDFISHVALAITHKEKEEVSEAIWHFERAFEMDPYNGAIQDELRDLYAHRDGLRPERINLTRGALARLYFRGNLFHQAASELRQILSQSGERLDLQTLLAETLWRDDQRVDVVDVCLRILEKTPNSIKANAILAEVWLVTGRNDEAHEYLQRLRTLTRPEKAHLDPDSVVGRAFNANGVMELPDEIFIEELDYFPVAQELTGDSDWVTELGIEAEEDEEANWLDEIEKVDAGIFAEAAGSDEDMLDWLREVAVAEDEPHNEPEDENATNLLSALEDEQLGGDDFESSQDDTFDWFSEGADTSRESLADVPDWLSEVTASAEADMWDIAIEANEGQAEVADDSKGSGGERAQTPDWIRDVAQENAGVDPTAGWQEEDRADSMLPEDDSSGLYDDDEIPDWMRGEGADADEFPDWLNEPEDSAESQEEALPDWLNSPEEETTSEEGFPDLTIDEATYSVTGEELPDWLLDEDDSIEGVEEPAAGMDSEEELDALFETDFDSELEFGPGDLGAAAVFDAAEDEDFPDWLSEPQETESAAEVELEEAVPDWMLEAEEIEIAEPEDESSDEDLPDWLIEAQEMELSEVEEEGLDEDIPDWLMEDTKAESAAIPEDFSFDSIESEIEDFSEEVDETPDWLHALGDLEETEVVEKTGQTVGEDLPDWMHDSPELILGQTDINEDSLPDWLDGDDLEEIVREDTLMGNSEDQENKEPDIPEDLDEAMKWLEELAAQQGADLAELPSLQEKEPSGQPDVVEGDEVPDWLKNDLSDGDLSAENDLPDWLKNEAVSTTDHDWLNPSSEDELSEIEMNAYDFGDTDFEDDTAIPSDDIPDWLKAQMPEDLQTDVGKEESDEELGWLDEIAAGAGAPLEEIPTLSWDDDTDDDALEGSDLSWLDDMAEEDGIPEIETPASMDIQGGQVEDVSTQVPDDPDEAMAWLEQLAAQQGAPLDELPTVIDEESSASDEISIEDLLELPDVDPDAETIFDTPEASEFETMSELGVPDDPDEAMAWLEQLAAQQGTPLEELPTMIDKESAEEADATPEMDSSQMPTVIDLPEETAESETMMEEGFEIPDDPDEAMAWLEQLAAKQGASLDELPTVDVMPEMDTPVTGIVPEAEEDEMLFEESEAVDQLELESDSELEMALADLSDIDMPEDEDEAMAWLAMIAGGDTGELQAESAFEEPEPEETAEQFDFEDSYPTQIETPEEQPQASFEEPEEVSLFDTIEDETDQFIDFQDDLTADIDQDLQDDELASTLPDWLQFGPVGDTSREELDWLDSFGDSDVDSWLEAEEEVSQVGLTPQIESAEPEPVAFVEPETELEQADDFEETTFEPASIPTGPVDQSQLESARSALEVGDYDTALKQYDSLLQSGQGLPLLIADLETASTRHTKVASLQRLLGDAYMQNGQLQKAIDTYRQALDNL